MIIHSFPSQEHLLRVIISMQNEKKCFINFTLIVTIKIRVM